MDGREVIICSSYGKLLRKKILFAGDFSQNPIEGTTCQIELSDVCFKSEGKECPADDGSKYFVKNFPGTIIIGTATHYLDIDFERCLQHVSVGEICLLRMIYHNNNREEALEVSCVIKMVKIDEVALFCDWHWAKKIMNANKHKDMGVKLVQEQKTIDAFRQFSKALKMVLTLGTVDFESMVEEDKKTVDDLKVKLYNNLAHCQLQFDEYKAVILLCDKVLEIDENNVKAIYRRGSAYMGLENWEAAYKDMNKVLTLDQSVSEAKVKMGILKEKVKDINDAYKKTIKSMFA